MTKKLLFIFYLLTITVLSLFPSDGIPDVTLFPHADKAIHFSMYAIFTFLMLWAWPERFPGKKQILPFLIVVAYGFFMEALQRYSNLGRSFDLSDELASSLGFFLGWLLWRGISGKEYLKNKTLYVPFQRKQVHD